MYYNISPVRTLDNQLYLLKINAAVKCILFPLYQLDNGT